MQAEFNHDGSDNITVAHDATTTRCYYQLAIGCVEDSTPIQSTIFAMW
jgi:hypothetical protein